MGRGKASEAKKIIVGGRESSWSIQEKVLKKVQLVEGESRGEGVGKRVGRKVKQSRRCWGVKTTYQGVKKSTPGSHALEVGDCLRPTRGKGSSLGLSLKEGGEGTPGREGES